jgi:aspartyl-tRNA(Asn)/glutamyl-tRNA(Gln) amidotransferase subunit C
MVISKDEVKYIAHLARIGLSEAEIEHFQKQLESILEYVDKLKKLDVSSVPPTAHVLDITNVYRSDTIKFSLEPVQALKIAPAAQGNFYKVPKVIEDQT